MIEKTIEIEYDLKNYAYNQWYEVYYSAESNGVETFDLYYDFTNKIHIMTTNDDFESGTIYIIPEKTDNWVGAGEGQGVLFSAGSAVWLTKE